jgi:hypothetical protein
MNAIFPRSLNLHLSKKIMTRIIDPTFSNDNPTSDELVEVLWQFFVKKVDATFRSSEFITQIQQLIEKAE